MSSESMSPRDPATPADQGQIGRLPDPDLADLSALAGKISRGYKSVGTMVYDILRDAILSGTLAPGQKLRQEYLADAIGVSRVPVRYALIQLEADGLIDVKDRRGATVRTLSRAQAEEIYALRILLESHALARSMQSMTPSRLANLRKLAALADQESEGTEFLAARTHFYSELYDASNREILWGLIEDLRLKVGQYMLGWRLVPGHSHSHTSLANVVAEGDVEAATAALREHLAGVRDGVMAILDRYAEKANQPQE
jgi:DNA-binding GntR family transcriptional regulator